MLSCKALLNDDEEQVVLPLGYVSVVGILPRYALQCVSQRLCQNLLVAFRVSRIA